MTALKWLFIGYGLLLTLAAGGLAFANIFGVIALAIGQDADLSVAATQAKTWTHVGWVFGVVVALSGAVLKMRKKPRGTVADDTSDTIVQDSSPSSSEGRRHGLIASSAWGGFFGALLGTALGVTFILLWFSIAYSPFAPNDWVSSVSVEKQRVANAAREEPVATTDHPIALLAFGLPVVAGAIAGAVYGGVVGATDVE